MCEGRGLKLIKKVKQLLEKTIHVMFFFFKQKTAYEIGTGDWSSDVCSSDLESVVENLIFVVFLPFY